MPDATPMFRSRRSVTRRLMVGTAFVLVVALVTTGVWVGSSSPAQAASSCDCAAARAKVESLKAQETQQQMLVDQINSLRSQRTTINQQLKALQQQWRAVGDKLDALRRVRSLNSWLIAAEDAEGRALAKLYDTYLQIPLEPPTGLLELLKYAVQFDYWLLKVKAASAAYDAARANRIRVERAFEDAKTAAAGISESENELVSQKEALQEQAKELGAEKTALSSQLASLPSLADAKATLRSTEKALTKAQQDLADCEQQDCTTTTTESTTTEPTTTTTSLPPPPPPPGGSSSSDWGDPHLVTFDRLAYDFQAEGEFVDVRSTADDFEVQISTQLWADAQDAGRVDRVATIDQVAVRTPADQVARYSLGGVTLDGTAIGAGTTTLTGGGSLDATSLALADGTTVEVDVSSFEGNPYLDVTVTLASARSGTVEGLVGNSNGSNADDITPLGSSTAIDPATLGNDAGRTALYDTFGPSWVPAASDRLFTGSARPYRAPLAPLTVADLDPVDVENATATCTTQGWTTANGLATCVYDVAVTGDNAFADPSHQSALWDGATIAGNVPHLPIGRDLVSVNTTGGPADSDSGGIAGAERGLAISADGRYVAFQSNATNLVAGDTNGAPDVFVRDLQTGTTTLVSVSAAGGPSDGNSVSPAISADGNHVAFVSDATDLVSGDTNGGADVFVRDLQTGTTTLVSVSATGGPSDGGGSPIPGIPAVLFVDRPSLSADGRHVAFESDATNLVAGDTNGIADVFVRDLQTGITTLVSVSATGGPSDGGAYFNSGSPSMSADGRYVAFQSNATNLVAGGDINFFTDVFVRDLQTGTTTLASASPTGGLGDNASFDASISADGRSVAFQSNATNLVAGDTNGAPDVFVRDLQTGTNTLVSVTPTGGPSDGNSDSPAISADGNHVAFESDATNLVAGDTNGVADVFVRDLQTGATTLVGVSATRPTRDQRRWSLRCVRVRRHQPCGRRHQRR